jgi:hypothetical protein
MLLSLGFSMTPVRYLYPDVPVDHVDLEVEIRARMADCIGCELRNGQLNGLANGLRLIVEESHGEVPSCRDTSRCSAKVLLQRARRHV